MEGSLQDLLALPSTDNDGSLRWYAAEPNDHIHATQYVLGSVLTILDNVTNNDMDGNVGVHGDLNLSTIMIDARQKIWLPTRQRCVVG